MGYIDAYRAIETTFMEARTVADASRIDQAGVYLLIDGIEPINPAEDKFKAVFIVASHTLDQKDGALQKVDEIRKAVAKGVFDINFDFVKRVEFISNSLYMFAVGVSMSVNAYEENLMEEKTWASIE